MFYKLEAGNPALAQPERCHESESSLEYQIDAPTPTRTEAADGRQVQAESPDAACAATAGCAPVAGCAADDLFGVPFRDTPGRFWENAAAFCTVALLGIVGATLTVLSGWDPLSLFTAAVSCGVTSGVMVWRASRTGSAIRSVAAATMLSAVLLALLLEIGRIILIFPGELGAVIAAVASWFVAYCIACFVVPMTAAFKPAQWSAAGTRLALNWHRAIGTVVLAAAYIATALPAALLVAPAPAFARRLLARAVRIPLWSWLLPLSEVARMASAVTGSGSPHATPRTWGTVLAAAGRSLATIPLVISGMAYALLATAAYVLAKLSAEATAEERKKK